MPTATRKSLEQRARQAILKSIVADYKQKHQDWLAAPAVRKAILTYSLFRTENALLIAAVILLSGCSILFLPLVMGASLLTGLVIGGIGGLVLLVLVELLFLYASFKNEKLHADAVATLFEPQVSFNPARLRDRELAAKVDKALEYWALIEEAVDKAEAGVLRDRLERTVQEATRWLQAVYSLAERVDRLRRNKVIERDLQTVPQAIADLRRKLAEEDSPEVRAQLEQTIADKERQLRILQDLQNSIEKADYQLDSTISSLGTVYSQLLLVDTKEESGSRLSRLQEEISEQVNRLEDLSEAMDEVYAR
ncbi:MAG: hypothetical protein D6784_16890 [Chloroflexi bacterium]|nr:MAG: hypothetical protein D6784_16890 [Chloroflexota bacterium]